MQKRLKAIKKCPEKLRPINYGDSKELYSDIFVYDSEVVNHIGVETQTVPAPTQ